MKRIPCLIALILLGACSTNRLPDITPADPVPVGADDTCGAAPYGYVVGQDATVLEKVLILREVRVNREGQPVGPGLRLSRINFNIGADDVIRSITCA